MKANFRCAGCGGHRTIKERYATGALYKPCRACGAIAIAPVDPKHCETSSGVQKLLEQGVSARTALDAMDALNMLTGRRPQDQLKFASKAELKMHMLTVLNDGAEARKHAWGVRLAKKRARHQLDNSRYKEIRNSLQPQQ